jgi:hypothetical protein
VSPPELGGQAARYWANESATQLKESNDENAVNRGGCRSSGGVRHIIGCGIGAGNASAGVEERH